MDWRGVLCRGFLVSLMTAPMSPDVYIWIFGIECGLHGADNPSCTLSPMCAPRIQQRRTQGKFIFPRVLHVGGHAGLRRFVLRVTSLPYFFSLRVTSLSRATRGIITLRAAIACCTADSVLGGPHGIYKQDAGDHIGSIPLGCPWSEVLFFPWGGNQLLTTYVDWAFLAISVQLFGLIYMRLCSVSNVLCFAFCFFCFFFSFVSFSGVSLPCGLGYSLCGVPFLVD